MHYQDMSVNAEKVTPDAKIVKSNTSSSLASSSGADGSTVCNLSQKLDDAAADDSTGWVYRMLRVSSHIFSILPTPSLNTPSQKYVMFNVVIFGSCQA